MRLGSGIRSVLAYAFWWKDSDEGGPWWSEFDDSLRGEVNTGVFEDIARPSEYNEVQREAVLRVSRLLERGCLKRRYVSYRLKCMALTGNTNAGSWETLEGKRFLSRLLGEDQ